MRSWIVALSCCACAWALFCVQPVEAATTTSVQTNDTFLPKQWYLDSIHAREAWNVATGSREVVVAVIDSGVDIDHPDLKRNIWTNTDETMNGKDDDGDGLVDDIHGWNFVSHSSDVRPEPQVDGLHEAWLHGTVVSSLIAAGGNDDIGIAGVSWRARIMPLVVISSNGYGRDEDIIDAIHYAVDHGADIINLSLVGYEFDQDLAQAVRDATSQGVLVVSAAGNSDDQAGQDMDTLPGYPACDKGAAGHGQLTVTALRRDNSKASYANYGACVDVSAPGEDMFAARPTHDPLHDEIVAGYVDGLSGTSLAAPLVSGLAVLLKAEHPTWRGPELAARILATSDPIDSADPKMKGLLGHGRINALRAVQDDTASERLGPLSLEAAAPGQLPQIRVVSQDGKLLAQFPVAGANDRRGVRATFVRWEGAAEPDIIVTAIGDTTGSWRTYRLDGVLVDAGSIGTGIAGGVFLSASDLNSTGTDDVFLGEANGSRAWLLTRGSRPQEIAPLKNVPTRGVLAVSVARPKPSFLVMSKYDSPEVAIIGQDGVRLAQDTLRLKANAKGQVVQRGDASGGGVVYDVRSGDGHLAMVSDASGLHRTDAPITVSRWKEVPEGQDLTIGWRFYASWPR